MKEQMIAVRKMQEYIRAHLHESITLKQLSRVADYSPYHCAKLFKKMTGFSPYYYIKSCRLSEAAMTLRDDETKVLDVALDYLFDSHEGFTRAFSKQFGVTPKRYAICKPPIPLFIPYPVVIDEQRREKMMQTIFTQVIERPARKVLIKRGIQAKDYFEYCEEVGCEVWGILCSIKEALYEPIGMWLPDKLIAPGTSKYVQGVELPIDYSNTVPEGFELIELPPCKIMIFQGEPFEGEDFGETMKAIWRYDPKVFGYAFDETNQPRFQLEPLPERGYIEGRPVKLLK